MSTNRKEEIREFVENSGYITSTTTDIFIDYCNHYLDGSKKNKLPVEDNSGDVVVLIESIFGDPAPAETFKEACRIATKYGKIIAVIPIDECLLLKKNVIKKFGKGVKGKTFLGESENYYYYLLDF